MVGVDRKNKKKAGFFSFVFAAAAFPPPQAEIELPLRYSPALVLPLIDRGACAACLSDPNRAKERAHATAFNESERAQGVAQRSR